MLRRLVSGFRIFSLGVLADGVYVGWGKVAYGTDDGVYLSDLGDPSREPVKVLSLSDVSQVDVLEHHQLLVVLSGGFRCRSVGGYRWNQ